jgi:hypothetical protein
MHWGGCALEPKVCFACGRMPCYAKCYFVGVSVRVCGRWWWEGAPQEPTVLREWVEAPPGCPAGGPVLQGHCSTTAVPVAMMHVGCWGTQCAISGGMQPAICNPHSHAPLHGKGCQEGPSWSCMGYPCTLCLHSAACMLHHPCSKGMQFSGQQCTSWQQTYAVYSGLMGGASAGASAEW